MPSPQNALQVMLFGYAHARADKLVNDATKLAHYTSAETALQILKGGSLWLRNATVMNDHSEIEHGQAIVAAALNLPIGERFWAVLDRVDPAIGRGVRERWALFAKNDRSKVFMASLSEHDQGDMLGRLSMWRAYGGPVAGAALIFNIDFLMDGRLGYDVTASPIHYGDIGEFLPHFEGLVERLEAGSGVLGQVTPGEAIALVSDALEYAVISQKHIGFGEEREWRLLHRPTAPLIGRVAPTTRYPLPCAAVSVRGMPQLVYQIPFGSIDEATGLTLNQLLNRVLIGPCLYPETVRQAFVETLREQDVTLPDARVTLSNIPLRQWG